MTNGLDEARRRLLNGAYTCVVLCDEREYTSCERGVTPLLSLLESATDCVGGVAADKTVGAGAAYLYVLLGVRALWANVVSASALQILQRYGIEIFYGTCVLHIINRSGDGICPIEAAVADAETAHEAHQRIKDTLQRLKTKNERTVSQRRSSND